MSFYLCSASNSEDAVKNSLTILVFIENGLTLLHCLLNHIFIFCNQFKSIYIIVMHSEVSKAEV